MSVRRDATVNFSLVVDVSLFLTGDKVAMSFECKVNSVLQLDSGSFVLKN